MSRLDHLRGPVMMVIGTAITVGNIRQCRRHPSIASVLLSALLVTAAVISPGALAAPQDTAVLPAPPVSAALPAPLPAELPAVLSIGDVALHQRIHAAHNAADWALADRLIGSLKDQRLLGHMLAERHLSPRFQPGYGGPAPWPRG